MSLKGRNPQRVVPLPMKFKTQKEEFAWAVGIFEGEGSFVLGGSKRWPALQMQLGMTDEDVVRKAAGILGLIVTGPYLARGPKYKPMSRATKGGAEARIIIEKMIPHLGTRRRARAKELLRATLKAHKAHKAKMKRRAKL